MKEALINVNFYVVPFNITSQVQSLSIIHNYAVMFSCGYLNAYSVQEIVMF